jgi:hypothetical protein
VLGQQQPHRALLADHRLAGEPALVEQVTPEPANHLVLGGLHAGRSRHGDADVVEVLDQPSERLGRRPRRPVVGVKVCEELLHHLGAESAG